MIQDKIKIINSIHVAGEDAKIVWSPQLLNESRALAMVNHNTKTITIDQSTQHNKMRTFKALMHETLHLLDDFMGLDLDEQKLDRIAQGSAVALVESGIVDLEELEFGLKTDAE